MSRRFQLKNIVLNLWMLLKSKFLPHSICLAISLIAGYVFSDVISITALNPTVGLLQNISLAMFTVAGIWIAYSYPQAIAAYTDPNKVTVIQSDETGRIESLVLIILTSAFVMAAILVHEIAYVISNAYVTGVDHRKLLKLVGISTVFYLSLIQIRAIWVIIFTNISFVNELYKKKIESNTFRDL